MKVLMIISEPREHYSGTLDFISMESGLIINSLNLEGIYNMDSIHIEHHDTVVSEPIKFYDLCTKQRYDIGDCISSIMFKDQECTNILKHSVIPDYYRVLSCKRGPICEEGRFANWLKSDQDRCGHLYSWECTAAHVVRNDEIVYYPEEDEFLQRTKKVFDIEIPDPRVRKAESIGYEIAKLMGYDIINILHY